MLHFKFETAILKMPGNNHLAYFDYKLTADGVPSVICIDSIDKVSMSANIYKELRALNESIQFFGDGIAIQKSLHGCPIFALNLAKQVYNDPGALDEMHDLNAKNQLPSPSHQPNLFELGEALDLHIPPSLIKHSQSTERTMRYLEKHRQKHPQTFSDAVNAKRQTLTEYQQLHLRKVWFSEKKRISTIPEKRLKYLKELRASLGAAEVPRPTSPGFKANVFTRSQMLELAQLFLHQGKQIDLVVILKSMEPSDLQDFLNGPGPIERFKKVVQSGDIFLLEQSFALLKELQNLGLKKDRLQMIIEVVVGEISPATGLGSALIRNDFAAVAVYFKGFKSLNFDKTQLQSIVQAKNDFGVLGLVPALSAGSAGNHETIKAYFEGIKTLGLEKDKAVFSN